MKYFMKQIKIARVDDPEELTGKLVQDRFGDFAVVVSIHQMNIENMIDDKDRYILDRDGDPTVWGRWVAESPAAIQVFEATTEEELKPASLNGELYRNKLKDIEYVYELTPFGGTAETVLQGLARGDIYATIEVELPRGKL